MNIDNLYFKSRIHIGIALLLFLFTAIYVSATHADSDANDNVEPRIAYIVLASNDERKEKEKKHDDDDSSDDLARNEEREKKRKRKEKKHDDDDSSDDDDDAPPAVTDNIIAAHDRNSPQYNRNCSNCHADIRTRESLDPNIPDAHVAMLPFAPGEINDDKQCTWCHRSVDLVQAAATPKDTGSSLRKQVDARLCTMCHGPGGSAKRFYQTTLEQLGPDGADLYDLACSGCHRVLENSEVRGESANEIHEAINEDEGGMAPLSALTDAQIQAIAGALAQ